jgi:hypothetical protein
MSYSELDRSWIRRYIGYGSIFVQSEPRLENAIQATQSVADGGTRPDSSTENYIKGLIYGFAAVTTGTNGVTPGATSTTGVTFNTPAVRGLLQIENAIATQDTFLGAMSADNKEVQIDPVREVARLRSEGRRLCGQLARMLGMKGVRMDVFSASPVIEGADDPFAYSDIETWRGGP